MRELLVLAFLGWEWLWLLVKVERHRAQSAAAQSYPDKSFAVATADGSLLCSFLLKIIVKAHP